MDNEHIEFRAGRDAYGLTLWVAGAVIEREQRDDGTWLRVLAAGSDSTDEARWVRPEEIRPLKHQSH